MERCQTIGRKFKTSLELGLAFYGSNPPINLSNDGISVNVARIKWFSKEDKVSLNIGEIKL